MYDAWVNPLDAAVQGNETEDLVKGCSDEELAYPEPILNSGSPPPGAFMSCDASV